LVPEVDPSLATEFALASLVVPVLGLGAYRLGAVDITGYVAGLFAGITVFWLGGWTWFVLGGPPRAVRRESNRWCRSEKRFAFVTPSICRSWR